MAVGIFPSRRNWIHKQWLLLAFCTPQITHFHDNLYILLYCNFSWCGHTVNLQRHHRHHHRNHRWQISHLIFYNINFACIIVQHTEAETNGRQFAVHISECIIFNENCCILIQISLKSVPKYLVNNTSALVPIVVWRRTGDKPLSEPMMAYFTDTYKRHMASMG